MRIPLLAAIVCGLAAAVVLSAGPALASCALPLQLIERADRAAAIAYVRVVGLIASPGGAPDRVALVHVERVLKGSVFADIGIGLGPRAWERETGAIATSVDYRAERGSDHTLYLTQDVPGRGYSTDVCGGSHVGPPTADEERLLGAGTLPAPTPTPPSSTPRALDLVAVVALVLGAAVVIYTRRSVRPRPAI